MRDVPLTAPYIQDLRGAIHFSQAPTALLLDHTGEKLVSFGSPARAKFLAATSDGQHGNYLYFERFKMALSKERRMGKSPTDVRVMGAGADRELPILTPYSMLLSAVKDEALARLHANQSSITRSEIRWVITVPAIWDDETKDFYRKVRGRFAY